MKKILVTLVALVCAVVGYAQQSTLVATLTHEKTITSYYGTFAFQKAVEAAVEGDVVTLSGGNFQAGGTVNKNITVRGAGIDGDKPTVILGDFHIEAPLEEGKSLSFEGIKFYNRFDFPGDGTMKVNFNKCHVAYADHSAYPQMHEECTYTNCVINQFTGDNKLTDEKLTFVNCVVCFRGWISASISMVNCVIKYYDPLYNYTYNSFNNCILINASNNEEPFDPSCSANNCLHIGSETFDVFTIRNSTNSIGTNNKSYTSLDIFEKSDWTKPLTSAAKEQYKGDDGTEIGIYGGLIPWSTTPSYPQISKLNISNRTTEDGQLNVEVEVNSVQQQ